MDEYPHKATRKLAALWGLPRTSLGELKVACCETHSAFFARWMEIIYHNKPIVLPRTGLGEVKVGWCITATQ